MECPLLDQLIVGAPKACGAGFLVGLLINFLNVKVITPFSMLIVEFICFYFSSNQLHISSKEDTPVTKTKFRISISRLGGALAGMAVVFLPFSYLFINCCTMQGVCKLKTL
jgi:hypothetical protein